MESKSLITIRPWILSVSQSLFLAAIFSPLWLIAILFLMLTGHKVYFVISIYSFIAFLLFLLVWTFFRWIYFYFIIKFYNYFLLKKLKKLKIEPIEKSTNPSIAPGIAWLVAFITIFYNSIFNVFELIAKLGMLTFTAYDAGIFIVKLIFMWTIGFAVIGLFQKLRFKIYNYLTKKNSAKDKLSQKDFLEKDALNLSPKYLSLAFTTFVMAIVAIVGILAFPILIFKKEIWDVLIGFGAFVLIILFVTIFFFISWGILKLAFMLYKNLFWNKFKNENEE